MHLRASYNRKSWVRNPDFSHTWRINSKSSSHVNRSCRHGHANVHAQHDPGTDHHFRALVKHGRGQDQEGQHVADHGHHQRDLAAVVVEDNAGQQ